MKKLSLILFLLLLNTAYALPVGNPSEASMMYPYQQDAYNGRVLFCDFLDCGVGFYGDYVFNRYMETNHDKDIDRTTLFTNAGYLVVNLCELIDLFSALGVSKLGLNTSLGAFNAADPHPLFEVETRSAFSYSVGARTTVLEYQCFALGFVAQFFSTQPDVKRMYIASGAVVYPNDIKMCYREWQVAAGLSYRYNPFFIPYAAIKFAKSHWRFGDGRLYPIEDNTGTSLYNMRNSKDWGYAVGLTLNPPACEQMAVTVEARFWGEAALYVNAQARF